MDDTVSIAIHSGKQEYFPLIENLIKSFLVCNEYPNIELLLIESAGNHKIREWFSSIDINGCFVNFDGTMTSITKNKNVLIEKTLLFLDFSDDVPWYVCYMDSLKRAIDASAGKYFVFLAEDNQFMIKGNVIGDYIIMLSNLGEESHMINFSAMQCYKYVKPNNLHGAVRNIGGVKYFPIENVKWDPTYFCDKKIYEKLGDFVFGDEGDPHRTINNFIEMSKKLKLSRAYKAIPCSIWFHNEHKDNYIKMIQKRTAINPDYILFGIDSLKETRRLMGAFPYRPIGTDDWHHKIREPV